MQFAPDQTDAVDHVARALGRLWLSGQPNTAEQHQQAQAIVSFAPATVSRPVTALSMAFEATMLATNFREAPWAVARVDQILVDVRATRFARACRLAEAAWVDMHLNESSHASTSLELLLAHGEVEADPRPPAERIWTDDALCALKVRMADYDGALRHGVDAESLIPAAALPMSDIQPTATLATLFLSVGDVDGALAVLPRGIAAGQRIGRPPYGLIYNHLLCLLLRERIAEAAGMLQPWRSSTWAQQDPAMLCLIARLDQAEGRGDTALALLNHPVARTPAAQPALAANQVWLRAEVRLAHGQLAEARSEVEHLLHQAATTGRPLSPMNRTRLQGVLSAACEAQGDLKAALAALKESQAAAFRWIADSVRFRLLALHLASPATDSQRLSLRMKAIEEQVAQSQEDGAVVQPARQMRFLAHVSHEMRNPLNGLVGMMSLLERSELSAQQRRYLDLALRSAQMLTSLCNDVLDLAKLDAGRFELSWALHDVGGLTRELVELLQPQAMAKGLQLMCHVDARLPAQLCVDRLRLQQVMMNLLGNALKFTSKGLVSIDLEWSSLAGDRGRLDVSVRDTGCGMKSEQLQRIFEEFSQAHAGIAAEYGGTGLGLALCRKLVGLMGGAIAVASELGQGTTFRFSVPMATAPAAAS